MRPSNGSRVKKSSSLLVSASLVAASVIGAWFFIENSKATESFLVTKQDMSSGSPLTLAEVFTKELSLFDTGANYLKPNQLIEGAYLVRSVAAGEVIPLSAITTQQLDDYSNVVLSPTIELSSQIRPGTKVSIWAAKQLDYSTFGDPVLIALDVEVVAIFEPQGNFATRGKSVELRVPLANVQYLLGSIANGDAIALTATGQSLGN